MYNYPTLLVHNRFLYLIWEKEREQFLFEEVLKREAGKLGHEKTVGNKQGGCA